MIGCGNVTEKKSAPSFNKIEGSKLVAVGNIVDFIQIGLFPADNKYIGIGGDITVKESIVRIIYPESVHHERITIQFRLQSRLPGPPEK